MSLHPHIQAALDGFQRRRRSLLLLRTALTGGGILLGGTLLIAVLDWVFFLPDWLRHTLATALYLSLATGLWLRGVRHLRTPEDPRTIARQMEAAAPSAHGQFLAAVELGLDPHSASGDSHEFRTLLHDRSAVHAAQIDPKKLIPTHHIHREALVAISATIAVISLFIFKGREFSILCLRALAPSANLARVSQFQIHIVAPTPSEGSFPEGEKLNIQAEVSGPAPAIPSLEVLGTHTNGRTPMQRNASGHFGAQIDIGTSPIEYRIRAGDALTQRFKILPVPRPHAVSFQKSFHSPSYLPLPVRKIQEQDGNLTALEGSIVELEIQIDQQVREAKVSLEHGGKPEMVPLEITADPKVYHCKIPIQEHGSYHLELISSTTGYASLSTPQFEIRAEPDTAPLVVLEIPLQDVAIPLGEKVQIRGHAEDDYGLATFTQAFRINQGPWKEVPLLAQLGKTADAERQWDPLLDHAKPGDLITTKLVATDAKGQRTESRSVQIAVALSGTLLSASKELAQHRAIHSQLQGLLKEAQEAAHSLNEVKAQSESRSPDVIKRDQAAVSAQKSLENALQKAANLRADLASALRNPSDLQTENDLRQTAKLLNRIQLADLQAARESLQEANDGASLRNEDKKEALRLATEAASQAAWKAQFTSEAFRAQLAAREGVALKESARALAKEQRDLTPQASSSTDAPPQDPQTEPSPTQRRQQVNEAAVRTLQEDLEELRKRGIHEVKEGLYPVREDLQKSRTAVEKQLGAPAANQASPDAIKASENLASSLERAGERLESLQPLLDNAATKARETLQRESRTASQRLEQSQHELESLAQRQPVSPQTRNSLAAVKTAAEAAALQADSTLESTKAEPEKTLAPDLATAARALRASVAENLDPKESAAKISALVKELRPVEAAAKIEQAAQAAKALHHSAGEGNAPITAAQKEAWKNVEANLQKLPDEARSAGLPESTTTKLREAFNSESNNRIRAATENTNNQNARPLEKSDTEMLSGNLEEASKFATEAVQAARLNLAKLAPTAAEEFKRLSAQAALAAENTNKLTEGIPAPAPQESPQSESKPPALADAQKEEARLSKQVAAAKEALVQEANQQNLQTQEGREKARDADASNALLRDSEKPATTLEQAAKAKETAAQNALVKKAAEEQSRLAKQLSQVAEHMENLQNGTPQQIARTRAALRESEKEAGVSATLEAMQKRSEELADLATATSEAAKSKLEQMTLASGKAANTAEAKNTPNAAESPQNSSSSAAQSKTQTASAASPPAQSAASSATPPSAEETRALQEALEALKNSPTENNTLPSSAATAIAAANKANRASQNSSRAQQTAQSSAPGNSSSNAPSEFGATTGAGGTGSGLPTRDNTASADWAKLPKRIANDLMEGKREQTSGEYQGAIESYFRTIAEKARQSRDSK